MLFFPLFSALTQFLCDAFSRTVAGIPKRKSAQLNQYYVTCELSNQARKRLRGLQNSFKLQEYIRSKATIYLTKRKNTNHCIGNFDILYVYYRL